MFWNSLRHSLNLIHRYVIICSQFVGILSIDVEVGWVFLHVNNVMLFVSDVMLIVFRVSGSLRRVFPKSNFCLNIFL